VQSSRANATVFFCKTMPDPKLDREFLKSILSLAGRPEVDALLYVSDVPLQPADLRGRRVKRKIVYAVTEERLAQTLRKQGYTCVTVPAYDYSRVEKVKVALVSAMTASVLRDGENVLCLTGRSGARNPDTLVRLQIGRGFEEKVAIDSVTLGAEFSSQVVEALVSLAMAVGHEGFEGHPIGTIFVLGDATAVMERSKQLTINPFQGMSEVDRNVLDPRIREALKNFAVLDGAFVIREDGVVLAAGRYLQVGPDKKDLPLQLGLGARHAVAAAITAETKAVTITVSQSSGTVRVFKDGVAVLELQQVSRRS
jgi:DNA integrity scanning protein DisA with diadenylate cyclase activity